MVIVQPPSDILFSGGQQAQFRPEVQTSKLPVRAPQWRSPSFPLAPFENVVPFRLLNVLYEKCYVLLIHWPAGTRTVFSSFFTLPMSAVQRKETITLHRQRNVKTSSEVKTPSIPNQVSHWESAWTFTTYEKQLAEFWSVYYFFFWICAMIWLSREKKTEKGFFPCLFHFDAFHLRWKPRYEYRCILCADGLHRHSTNKLIDFISGKMLFGWMGKIIKENQNERNKKKPNTTHPYYDLPVQDLPQ